MYRITLSDGQIFEMSDYKSKVIANDIPRDILADDIQRRYDWIKSKSGEEGALEKLHANMQEKYENCFRRLSLEWEYRLLQREIVIPIDNEQAFAEAVFLQVDYQDRFERDQNSEG